MDLFTLIGMVVGIGLLVVSILMKAPITAFIDVASMLIVIGGTFASTFISFSGGSIMKALKDMVTTFFKHNIVYSETVEQIVKLAEVALRQGMVALEKEKVQSEFMERGINYLAAGLKPDAIQNMMTIEKQSQRDRELESQTILEKMGDLAPAWGMVGTLIGLVIMMLNLDDPSTIGPSMAVALLTTFYGAVIANLVFLPSSTKIEHRSNKGVLHHDLIIEGIISIARKENPRIIKDKLMGYMKAPIAGESKEKPPGKSKEKPPGKSKEK